MWFARFHWYSLMLNHGNTVVIITVKQMKNNIDGLYLHRECELYQFYCHIKEIVISGGL